jgi:hypothetical protein
MVVNMEVVGLPNNSFVIIPHSWYSLEEAHLILQRLVREFVRLNLYGARHGHSRVAFKSGQICFIIYVDRLVEMTSWFNSALEDMTSAQGFAYQALSVLPDPSVYQPLEGWLYNRYS